MDNQEGTELSQLIADVMPFEIATRLSQHNRGVLILLSRSNQLITVVVIICSSSQQYSYTAKRGLWWQKHKCHKMEEFDLRYKNIWALFKVGELDTI